MASYPIWNKVQACIYKSNKSYGVREDGQVSIKVGTSATNSYDFLTHTTTHRKLECGGREFRFYIDDISYEKPNAKYYIDDKAIMFLNWEMVMGVIDA